MVTVQRVEQGWAITSDGAGLPSLFNVIPAIALAGAIAFMGGRLALSTPDYDWVAGPIVALACLACLLLFLRYRPARAGSTFIDQGKREIVIQLLDGSREVVRFDGVSRLDLRQWSRPGRLSAELMLRRRAGSTVFVGAETEAERIEVLKRHVDKIRAGTGLPG